MHLGPQKALKYGGHRPHEGNERRNSYSNILDYIEIESICNCFCRCCRRRLLLLLWVAIERFRRKTCAKASPASSHMRNASLYISNACMFVRIFSHLPVHFIFSVRTARKEWNIQIIIYSHPIQLITLVVFVLKLKYNKRNRTHSHPMSTMVNESCYFHPKKQRTPIGCCIRAPKQHIWNYGCFRCDNGRVSSERREDGAVCRCKFATEFLVPKCCVSIAI